MSDSSSFGKLLEARELTKGTHDAPAVDDDPDVAERAAAALHLLRDPEIAFPVFFVELYQESGMSVERFAEAYNGLEAAGLMVRKGDRVHLTEDGERLRKARKE